MVCGVVCVWCGVCVCVVLCVWCVLCVFNPEHTTELQMGMDDKLTPPPLNLQYTLQVPQFGETRLICGPVIRLFYWTETQDAKSLFLHRIWRNIALHHLLFLCSEWVAVRMSPNS